MASDQKYKEGTAPSCTGREQPGRVAGVHRPAAVLQDPAEARLATARPVFWATISPPSWEWREERVLWACIPGDFSGQLLFCFEAARRPGWSYPPIQTQTRRKKLTGGLFRQVAPDGGLPAAGGLELALNSSDGRCMVFHTRCFGPKTTRTRRGERHGSQAQADRDPGPAPGRRRPPSSTPPATGPPACLARGHPAGGGTGGRSSCPFWVTAARPWVPERKVEPGGIFCVELKWKPRGPEPWRERMMPMETSNVKKTAVSYFWITVGSILYAIGFDWFIPPTSSASAGSPAWVRWSTPISLSFPSAPSYLC